MPAADEVEKDSRSRWECRNPEMLAQPVSLWRTNDELVVNVAQALRVDRQSHALFQTRLHE